MVCALEETTAGKGKRVCVGGGAGGGRGVVLVKGDLVSRNLWMEAVEVMMSPCR